MTHCKGTVTALRQHAGCIEVEVAGERPGSFVIDNCCFGMIAANEGTAWIGRLVEYMDAHMRFLDSIDPDHTADEDYAPLAHPAG